MDFIRQSHDDQFSILDRFCERLGLERIGLSLRRSRAGSGTDRDDCPCVTQIQGMGSSLVPVAKDRHAESGWIGFSITGGDRHGANATGWEGFFAAIQIRSQMNR